jgi:16S rRNA C1402 N4-methylase RsmH
MAKSILLHRKSTVRHPDLTSTEILQRNINTQAALIRHERDREALQAARQRLSKIEQRAALVSPSAMNTFIANVFAMVDAAIERSNNKVTEVGRV